MIGSVRQPFRPKGELPEWRMIFDELLADADFGTLVTYDQLDAALGRPFVENRTPIYRARQHLGETRRRWFESVPGVGYRIIEANEHLRVAERKKKEAKGRLTAMMKVTEAADLSRLSASELTTFDAQSRVNAMLYTFVLHVERRVSRIEDVLQSAGLF